MTVSPRWVCFSHGKESGPRGTKIDALAQVAARRDWQVESIDYRGVDDPHERVRMLETWCRGIKDPFVLVGSSMGGHVAAAAANGDGAGTLGVFLMAPAFYVPGYARYTPAAPACATQIVHGWGDEVIPWQNSARFAERAGCRLLMLAAEHRLAGVVAELCAEFDRFLAAVELLIEAPQE